MTERVYACPKCAGLYFLDMWDAAKGKCKGCSGKPRKYRNQPTTIDGIWYASREEAAYCHSLRLRERAGEIHNLVLQPPFPIVVNGIKVAIYYADAAFDDPAFPTRHIIDVKSPATSKDKTYRLKKKIVEAQYSIKIVEILT